MLIIMYGGFGCGECGGLDINPCDSHIIKECWLGRRAGQPIEYLYSVSVMIVHRRKRTRRMERTSKEAGVRQRVGGQSQSSRPGTPRESV